MTVGKLGSGHLVAYDFLISYSLTIIFFNFFFKPGWQHCTNHRVRRSQPYHITLQLVFLLGWRYRDGNEVLDVKKLSDAGRPENAVRFLRAAFQLLPEGSQEHQDVSRLTIRFTGNLCPFLLVPVLHSLSALHVNSWPKYNYRGESCTWSLPSGCQAAFSHHIVCFPSGWGNCICSDLSFLGQGWPESFTAFQRPPDLCLFIAWHNTGCTSVFHSSVRLVTLWPGHIYRSMYFFFCCYCMMRFQLESSFSPREILW